MNQLTIDLSGIKSEAQILHKLGAALDLGGTSGGGWGMNWDGLNGALQYLETGGIWGTSKVFEFPLTIVFENSRSLKENDKRTFRSLMEILEQTAEQYKRDNKIFKFEFK